MKDKRIEKQVKLLARQKKFEQIYEEYGPYFFRKYVSTEYKKDDVERLHREEKYLKIYEKYGETYEKIVESYLDSEEEKNNLPSEVSSKGLLSRCKKFFKWLVFPLVGTIIGNTTVLNQLAQNTDNEIKENTKKYEKEIKEYENEVEEYAKKFDVEKQSDMEIIMRTMKDMHETIRGYGEPEMDIKGYLGIDVMEDGIGVCRNMAPNIADKLNEINPEYNARTIELYSDSSDYIENNIERNIIEENQIINIKGNIQKIYEEGQLKKKIISQKDKAITYEYEIDGSISNKIIETQNQKEEISYDENGKISQNIKSITEKDKDNIITKIYVDDKLYSIEKKEDNCFIIEMYNDDGQISETIRKTTENKNNNKINKTLVIVNEKIDTTIIEEIKEDSYVKTAYNEDGTIKSERIANNQEDISTYYKNEEKTSKIIIKDGYKIDFWYEDGKEREISRKEANEDDNIFVQLKKEEDSKKEIIYHVIVAVDIDSDNVTLLIDPTNPGLGVYKDGKIYMFNEEQPEKAVYDRKFVRGIINDGTEALIDYPIDYIKSFRKTKLSMEELEEKYGLEAQNKMLAQIEKEDNQKTFKEELKIDKGITYNFDTNVVTIDNRQREENEKEH